MPPDTQQPIIQVVIIAQQARWNQFHYLLLEDQLTLGETLWSLSRNHAEPEEVTAIYRVAEQDASDLALFALKHGCTVSQEPINQETLE